jgi:hypothetical protein
MDVVFSYSVMQHLGPDDCRSALAEAARVLKPGGLSLHQLPNAYGLRNVCMQARRGFREPRDFEVRYWRPRRLLELFEELIGPTELEADGFLSLNARPCDADLVPTRFRPLLRVSEGLRRASARVGALRYAADSLLVASTRRTG